MKRLPGLLIIFGIVFAAGTSFLSNAHAQNDTGTCDNPFAGLRIRFNPGFWELTDFCQHSIDYEEVLSGGMNMPPDRIPPIDDPQYESIDAASAWLQDQSPVVSVIVNDVARAYPLAVLTWHEIVNTEQGDMPITITYCPLCNSAIVFDRNVDETVLDFGVSGNLRNSDLIMYDRQTESWWQQFTGEGIVGEYTGTQLTMLPSQIIGFGEFAEAFPDAEVLSRDTGAQRNYGVNPYPDYDSGRPFLFEGEIDSRLPSTSRVLAGLIGSEAIAYPYSVLQDEILVNDTVDEREVLAIWQPGVTSALDGRNIDESRDVGTAAIYSRVLEDNTVLTFTVGDDGAITDDQTGSIWNSFGRAESGELEGTQLRQLVAAPHFWFAWATFQPETIVYGLES